MRQRQTLSKIISFDGFGINTGEHSSLKLQPATDGLRWFLNGNPLQCPKFQAVQNTTSVAHGGTTILCIEHLSAALYFSGVTDVDIHLTGAPEVPFLDGSAETYVRALRSTPLMRLQGTQPKAGLIEGSEIRIETDEGWATITPSPKLSFSITIDYPDPLGTQLVDIKRDIEFEAIMQSRSFIRDPIDIVPISTAQSRLPGLGNIVKDNALILWTTDRVITPLKMEREWAYHKALDLLGDLGCLGLQLSFSISAHKPGHRLNGMIREQLMRL